jgi:HEAT repeats
MSFWKPFATERFGGSRRKRPKREHINLTGDYVWRQNRKVEKGNSGRYDHFRYLSVLYIPFREATPDKLQAELVASLSDPDRKVAHIGLEQIGNVGHGEYGVKPNLQPKSVRTLEEIAATGDPESRGLAYTALIKLEDYAILQPAIEFAESRQQFDSDTIIDAVSDIGEVRIREAKKATDDPDMECPSETDLPFDKSVLPTLHALLSSPNVNLRRSAAHALRGICDPSSVSFLVRAVDDDDHKVQYDALQGLAALEDFPADRPAPATSIFNTNPAKYLDNWKNWWMAGGRQKYNVKP